MFLITLEKYPTKCLAIKPLNHTKSRCFSNKRYINSSENSYTTVKKLHRPGIEPGPPAWQARILPLNQRCSVEYCR